MQRKYALKRNYGITMEEYQALHEVQGGVCAICGQPETTVQGRTNTPFCLAVDHDHDTGKVRGLLCTPCNRGIGFLRDDPAILERALEYLNGSS